MKLSEAEIKRKVKTIGIKCGEGAKSRLYALGVYEGSVLTVERFALFKEGLLVYVNGRGVMIDREIAEAVEVEYV